MAINTFLSKELDNHFVVLQRTVTECDANVINIVNNITVCFERGNKVLLCGNGGSAADAQHVAAEFINQFRFDRPALPAIALTTDSSILTCIGNDSSFDFVFSRQVEALANKGDILVGISTSGSSKNVLNALDVARKKGIQTIGFTGEKGRTTMGNKCDICLIVPSTDTARIQEAHEFVWHFICGVVEERLFGTASNT
jgi:D-sedoheptulose 7-phosphate isomerase